MVNDLDVVITNLDNNTVVYLGNDIRSGANFNSPLSTNGLVLYDSVNNVENIFIPPPLSTNLGYSVTVIARAVNVNAVTAHPNQTAQDYALVISSGNGQVTNALTLTAAPSTVSPAYINVNALTNQFSSVPNSTVTGQLLLNQHVGASSPLLGNNTIALGSNTVWGVPGTNGVITLGVTNQWHFYIVTNTQSYTNAAFITFLPPTLSIPRMGVTNYGNAQDASRVEADIDMYVSQNPGLLTLDPNVVAQADKSVGRGGTEVIAYTNAQSGTYYIGIKAEDQQAAEYGFFAGFSQSPFSQSDSDGTLVQGINIPTEIPDGSTANPGIARILAICVDPITVRRVLVSDLSLTHENLGDLIGNLSHNQKFAVLHDHHPGDGRVTPYNFAYEDDDEAALPNAQHTDGPGSLRDFVGESGVGLWLLTEVDDAQSHTGRVNNVTLRLAPQLDVDGSVTLTIQPNTFAYDFIDVPPEATNLTISVVNISSMPLPLQLYVRRGDYPTLTTFDYTLPVDPVGTNILSISKLDFPPLQAGRYFIGIYNPNAVAQTVRLVMQLTLDIDGLNPILYTSTNAIPILDDAVTYSSLWVTNGPVTNNPIIVRADVGVAINHPRVSDLALTLVSPEGKRILLYENRGGTSATGLGSATTTTNFFGTQVAGGAATDTNNIGPVPLLES